MNESPLNAALRQFEAVEANLGKAERLLEALINAVPTGIHFGSTPEYDQSWREFHDIIEVLPKIDGWKAEIYVMGLEEVAQNRLDACELGEVEFTISVETRINEPPKQLAEYRYRFNKKRRQLVRGSIHELIDRADERVRLLAPLIKVSEVWQSVDSPDFEGLKASVAELAMLLGSSIPKPPRWTDLNRHLSFGLYGDLCDIVQHDWPTVSADLRKSMYGENEAIPVDVEDLGALVNERPRGPVATRLKWEVLDDDDFERLVFVLISSASGYQNPEWLMRTNAPDRGRDLSVYRVHEDALSGSVRLRIIIQCKHWQSKSISISEIALLKEQMKLWEPPRLDICVIASSGRFTSDAVAAIERHNASDSALRIEMWPESHLERLLAMRPAIIAEFGLR